MEAGGVRMWRQALCAGWWAAMRMPQCRRPHLQAPAAQAESSESRGHRLGPPPRRFCSILSRARPIAHRHHGLGLCRATSAARPASVPAHAACVPPLDVLGARAACGLVAELFNPTDRFDGCWLHPIAAVVASIERW